MLCFLIRWLLGWVLFQERPSLEAWNFQPAFHSPPPPPTTPPFSKEEKRVRNRGKLVSIALTWWSHHTNSQCWIGGPHIWVMVGQGWQSGMLRANMACPGLHFLSWALPLFGRFFRVFITFFGNQLVSQVNSIHKFKEQLLQIDEPKEVLPLIYSLLLQSPGNNMNLKLESEMGWGQTCGPVFLLWEQT